MIAPVPVHCFSIGFIIEKMVYLLFSVVIGRSF